MQRNKSIVVVDYEAGNLHNVGRALKALHVPFYLSKEPEEIETAGCVILPGVGSARAAMDSLRAQGLLDALRNTRAPILGICLGMQLFFEESEEDTTRCLGLLPGKVRKFDDQAVKVPHIGWNQIHFSQDSGHSSPLLQGIPSGSFFYFVHSYYAPVEGFSVAKTDYSVHFSSALHFRNLWGVQFHPELSGALGLHMLQNFLSECRQE